MSPVSPHFERQVFEGEVAPDPVQKLQHENCAALEGRVGLVLRDEGSRDSEYGLRLKIVSLNERVVVRVE